MAEAVENSPTPGQAPGPPSAIIVLLQVLTRWWRFILVCVLTCMIISGAVAFLITPQFKSATSVFPSEKADLFGALEGVSSLVKSFSPRGLASLGANTELDRYMAILKSGRVLSEVIQKFDLVHVYNITSYPGEKTAKKLLENVEFMIESEGNLTITVYDEDPQRAADMANFFVEQLNRANSELLTQNARGNRRFIEERYNKNIRDLAAAEESLKVFQKIYGVIAMPQQTEASIKAGAELSAQLAMKEVQLEVLKRTLSLENPTVLGAQIEVQELKKKISEMNRGVGSVKGEMQVFVPLNAIPDLGSEYLRRFRDVEIQYKILQFLTPLFEQAKVEEQRQTPSVIVLDRASPAERKSRPKRSLIILGGMFVGLLGSFAYVAGKDKWTHERDRNSPLYRSTAHLFEVIKSDIGSFGRRKGN